MSAVQLFGYLRPHASLKAHEIPGASDEALADALCWAVQDWRGDPEWPCAAIGSLTIERVPMENYAASQVAALRKKEQELRAAFEASVTEIQRQINSLLAVENSPGEVPA